MTHSLLLRQLRKLGLAADALPSAEAWRALLARVEQTYVEADRDRYTLERSLMISSREMQQLYDELRRSEANFKVLVERIPDAVFVHRDDIIQYANPAMATILGFDRAETLIGLSVLETIVHPDDHEEILDRRQKGPPSQLDAARPIRWLRKDGAVIWMLGGAIPIVFNDEPASVVIAHDVTDKMRDDEDRTKLEEQLRQSQKMDAIGRLAGGIAHDFNNILTVIQSYAETAIDELGTGHPVAGDIREIYLAGGRAAALTHQLLTFSRQQPARTTIVPLSAIVGGLQGMLSRIIGEDIQMDTNLGDGKTSVEVDRCQMEQMVVNLVVNARDAMPSGGRITVKTSEIVVDESMSRRVSVPPGRCAVLEVTDTGCGMDEATQARIFEPFFTTKKIGQGTGLGLATVFGIVKQAGGGLSVSSEPGKGTTFRVLLPSVSPAAQFATPARPLEKRASGSETILVVEDEKPVRAIICKILRGAGYRVVEADGGRVALDLLLTWHQVVNLVVTDVVMPEVDGRSLGATVGDRYPHVKVLYMSGYTAHPAVNGAAIRFKENFIQKPFTAASLREAIRRTLTMDEEVEEVTKIIVRGPRKVSR